MPYADDMARNRRKLKKITENLIGTVKRMKEEQGEYQIYELKNRWEGQRKVNFIIRTGLKYWINWRNLKVMYAGILTDNRTHLTRHKYELVKTVIRWEEE